MLLDMVDSAFDFYEMGYLFLKTVMVLTLLKLIFLHTLYSIHCVFQVVGFFI